MLCPCPRAGDRSFNKSILARLVFGQELGHGFALGADEMAGKVLGQQRIALGAGDGFLGVLAMFVLRTRESDQRGGKFHLCVRAAQSERPFSPGRSRRHLRLDRGPIAYRPSCAAGSVRSIVYRFPLDSRRRTRPARRSGPEDSAEVARAWSRARSSFAASGSLRA